MKKRIIFLIAFIVLMLSLAGCNKNNDKVTNNNQNENQIQNVETEKEKPLNEAYDLTASINNMQNTIGDSARLLTEEEVAQKYNLEGLEETEKNVLINVSETSYEEIAIIKLTSTEQVFPVQKMMNDRLQSLKEEYKENTEISAMLENNENVKIKILDNVGIFIVSSNAESLLHTFDNGI